LFTPYKSHSIAKFNKIARRIERSEPRVRKCENSERSLGWSVQTDRRDKPLAWAMSSRLRFESAMTMASSSPNVTRQGIPRHLHGHFSEAETSKGVRLEMNSF
jgi:glutamate/tyrosine decarboxylase-like PLP-dependent enzyme